MPAYKYFYFTSSLKKKYPVQAKVAKIFMNVTDKI